MTKRTLTRVGARELTLHLLRMKASDHPDLIEVRGDDVAHVVFGIKRAILNRGINLDEEAAEGIAEAVQEFIPGARDDAAASHGMFRAPSRLLTPARRARIWHP